MEVQEPLLEKWDLWVGDSDISGDSHQTLEAAWRKVLFLSAVTAVPCVLRVCFLLLTMFPCNSKQQDLCCVVSLGSLYPRLHQLY